MSRVLLIKHLPSCITNHDKEDLLKYFGATHVRVMPLTGRMKHCAFATFSDAVAAGRAMERLHQVELFGCVLCVEFAKEISVKTVESVTENISSVHGNKSDRIVVNSTRRKSLDRSEDCQVPVAPQIGLYYPANPRLKYSYPPPDADSLINICSALLAVPNFYTQVLHLMNKMNLVPPFSVATSIPPMLIERVQSHCKFSESEPTPEPDKLDLIEMSESESEYETTDSESGKNHKKLDDIIPNSAVQNRKRKITKSSAGRTRKKLKEFVGITPAVSASTVHLSIDDAFDEPSLTTNKTIDIKVPTVVTLTAIEAQHPDDDKISDGGGFGKMLSQVQTPEHDTQDIEQKDLKTGNFITERELRDGRLSKKEMDSSSLYKEYEPGCPSCRLYIKNLSKKVSKSNLEFIFGRFVDFANDADRNMFDVQLLTRGRMKGQAFIGLPTVEAASKALSLVNGYRLLDKPMIVHFARSKTPS